MENNTNEDIYLICEHWANEDGSRLCDKLDKLIYDLAGDIVSKKFKHEQSILMFGRVLSLKKESSDGDENAVLSACKYLVDNIVSSALFSNSNVIHRNINNLLEMSLECLIKAGQDDFCKKYLELISTNIPQPNDCQNENCKNQSFMSAIECMLNALISSSLNPDLKSHKNTMTFLQSCTFHRQISDLVLNCENQTLLSHVLLSIVPKLVMVSEVRTVLNILWDGIKSSPETGEISLSLKLFVMCGLADSYISNAIAFDNSIVKSQEFWKLIQDGLVSGDALLRKKGLYLLKRSIDAVILLNLTLDIEIFSWNVLNSDLLQLFWEKMFILFEVLEEKQAHLVIPVIQSALKQPVGEDLKLTSIHPSWLLVVYKRLLSHDSLQVIKLGILYFLKMKIEVYLECSYKFIIQILFHKLNNMLIFSCHSSNADWSEVDSALKEWFTSIMLKTEKRAEFFSVIIDAMVKVQWCTIPLFHILHNMSVIPAAEIFDERQMEMLCDFLKEAVRTQNVFVRGAVQCAVLSILTKHTKKNINMVQVVNTLNVFKKNECLHRGLETWGITKNWIQSCISFKGETVLVLLLSDKNNLSLESKARCLVLCVDSGLIDLDSSFQKMVENHFSVLVNTFSRLYASVEKSDACLELILHILKESKTLSPKIELKNDALIKSITPYINEIIPYISKRLCYDTDDESRVHFENVELYLKTLQALTDSGLISLTEGKTLNTCAEKIDLSLKLHLVQRYFVKKIHLWFIQFVAKEKGEHQIVKNIKSYCISVVENDLKLSLPKDGNSEEKARNTEVYWSRLVSAYIHSLWAIIQQCVDAQFVSVTEILSVISADELIHLATNSIELGGRDSFVPILRAVKQVFPYTNRNNEVFQRFLQFTWKSCFELRKVATFWPSIKAWIEMIFNRELIVVEEVQKNIVNFSEQILTQGETVWGLSNVLLFHLKQELRDVKCVKPLLGTLTTALMFGPVPRRDQRIEADTCALIASLGSSYAVNDLIPRGASDSSHEVRAYALSIIVSVASWEGGGELVVSVVQQLLARDAALTAQRQRYHGDTLHHRLKHRTLQALLVLEALLADSSSLLAKSCVVELVKWSSTSLQGESQQPSVRYQLEWLLVRSLLHSPHLVSSFWTIFNQASEERTGSICSFISVAYHLAVCLRDQAFTDRCVTEILPWCMAQHFNVRLYAQVVLQKLWPLHSEVASKYEAIRKSLSKSLNQGNSVRNADKLKNDFYFTAFQPLDDFSLETIFWELPRLSNISKDEWIPMVTLQQCFAGHGSSLVLANKSDSLSQFSAASWVVKATAETEVGVEACGLQKKFVPWKGMFPELELSKEPSSRTELVVVASLIDKLPNLGGLARSCEIFAAQSLVVPSLEYTQDKLFSTLSMSAEKHINIVEVKPHNLPQYLNEKKRVGYTLVGAEQTAASVSLDNYKFPKKCLLLLGNEKEGIPVNLLPLLDICVEVPQLGVVRSLNVHVTGALFLWEYTKQYLASTSTLAR